MLQQGPARDLEAGFGEVYLPHLLARKYPNAPREIGWQYLFPATEDERTDRRQVHRVTISPPHGTLGDMNDQLRVRLVQRAASLDPAQNRAELASVPSEGVDLVVWPEAFARDFGEPGSDLAAYAETVDGPFADALTAMAGRATAVAGMFETSGDRGLRLLRVQGVRCADRRRGRARCRRGGGLAGRPDDLL